MCLKCRTTHAHIQLLDATCSSWCTTTALTRKIPYLSPIEHVWYMMKLKLTPAPQPAANIAELRQWVQDNWDNLPQEHIRHIYDRLFARIHACVAPEEVCHLFMCLFGHLLGQAHTSLAKLLLAKALLLKHVITCFLLLKIRHVAHQSRKTQKCLRARFGTI